MTYDGTDVTLYYNGQDAGVGAGQKSFTPSALGDCIFKSFSFMGGSSGDGGHGTGSEWWGDCKILCTEARVWSVCRTPDQIVNNIKSVSPTAQGLEGYWKMSRKTILMRKPAPDERLKTRKRRKKSRVERCPTRLFQIQK